MVMCDNKEPQEQLKAWGSRELGLCIQEKGQPQDTERKGTCGRERDGGEPGRPHGRVSLSITFKP
jgi:hypothetical protein